ncbi:GDSL-type esterase/lipase family protein [Cellulophaga sp. F20128]|uniref:SGNH/GDSL hydrolase family protein n=1 Tax=Cellulophaga sp. F20128 TaxID=2926413 RepID=UPI001FF1FB08|nr:GDSL-type esterase/lipase family protein [Cellulophaga sp. F20128]MCK0156470.1 GDSL-type esterase/lipase family protein [Cellulophaga sp. F20128]
MKFIFTLLFILAITFGTAQKKEKIKVACIGNSITVGHGIKDRLKDAYPVQLERMLGEDYEVKNFGVSGRTLLSKGNSPYIETGAYKQALAYNPDIILIKLGTNDSKDFNWIYKDEFTADYLKLIKSFQSLPSKPTIHLCLAVPVYQRGKKISADIVEKEVNPKITEIARTQNLNLIDLYTPMLRKGDFFPDDIHPNAKGASEIAKLVYTGITGNKATLVEQNFPGKKSDWKGFTKYTFEFNKTNAFVIEPTNALSGKPWVWRARFPGWHTEMDSILLSEGYHIAYLNTDDQFGSPKAVKSWDSFYKYLIRSHDFSVKVALEGVSRGGLFVYNWAKKNPELVSCIYAEAPVCDFTSWPGGFGTGIGSERNWKILKEEYGFSSDAEAKQYADNPIDNLEALAKAKVPILHMISLTDSVVPPKENTFPLINKYIELGGIATVVTCTEGKQTLHGHHFPIETPRLGADFIKYHTKKEPTILNSAAYHNLRGGLQNSFLKFQREKTGRVAFLGGSITYNGGWRDSITNYLKTKFPETKFEFIAAGIPSTGSTPAAFRMERDLFKGGPVDLLFEEAAVNDDTNGRTNEEQIRAMEGIVRHARYKNPATDIVIMHFVDPGKMKSYRNGIIPQVIQNHEKVAKHYNIPTINLAKEVTDRIDAGEFSWTKDFKNLHPSPFGQGIYAHSMLTLLDNAWTRPMAEDDKIGSYHLPDPIDPFNYDKGMLIDINTAKLSGDWRIVENWKPQDGKGTRHNYTDVPMLISEQINSGKATLTFTGNTVGIAVAAGPDSGTISYRIDGGTWQKLDLLTNWSRSLHLPWFFTLASGLKNTKHKLQIKIIENEDPSQRVGNACRIRYFYSNK